jgi:hypothetical protein
MKSNFEHGNKQRYMVISSHLSGSYVDFCTVCLSAIYE